MEASPRYSLIVLSVVTAGLLSFVQPALAAEIEGHTARINGIELYYETAGDGEPLLLLHSGTQTTRMWHGFADQFSKDYRLIMVDLRGHGRSTNPDNQWSTRQFGSDDKLNPAPV